MWLTFPAVPSAAVNSGALPSGQAIDQSVIANHQTEMTDTSHPTFTPVPDSAIDPSLLALSAALPTPRQTASPAPTVIPPTAARPRARPKGKAALVGIRPAQQPLINPDELGEPPLILRDGPAETPLLIPDRRAKTPLIIPNEPAEFQLPAIDPVVLQHVTSTPGHINTSTNGGT